eukprot:m.18853 g.18853  ORF g.18853 m.18853 type:complete len:182 (+) comp3377_c0_seq1:1185-1730(+)
MGAEGLVLSATATAGLHDVPQLLLHVGAGDLAALSPHEDIGPQPFEIPQLLDTGSLGATVAGAGVATSLHAPVLQLRPQAWPEAGRANGAGGCSQAISPHVPVPALHDALSAGRAAVAGSASSLPQCIGCAGSSPALAGSASASEGAARTESCSCASAESGAGGPGSIELVAWEAIYLNLR